MSNRKKINLIMSAISSLLCISTPSLPTRSQVSAITVGALTNNIREMIKEIENSAHSLIEQGNNAAAQQQMLIAGILAKLLDQMLVNYGQALDKTVSSLSKTEQNVFDSTINIVEKLEGIEAKTSKDVRNIIYQTQSATNQVISRLPFSKNIPLLFGVNSRDLSKDDGESPSDIELLGFHLVDGDLKKIPEIKVAGAPIPHENITVFEDRLQIKLSSEIKSKIGFTNTPCEPRKTYQVEIKTFYNSVNGYWPITWSSEKVRSYNINALPGSDVFSVQTYYSGEVSSTALKQESFRARGGYTAMQCEQTVGSTVSHQLPKAAEQIQCSASWVNTSNVKSQSQNCAIGGITATGTGSISGRNRDCYVVGAVIGLIAGRKNVCNCPGGGHGELEIAGTYKVPQTNVTAFENKPIGNFTLLRASNASFRIPSDTSIKIRNVVIRINRKNCDAIHDEFELNMGDPNHRIVETSKNGLVEAILWNNSVNIQWKQ